MEVKASAKKEKVAQQTEPEKYPEGLDVQPILDDPRLPKHVLPEHYDLYLHPDLGIFQGSAAAPQPHISLSFKPACEQKKKIQKEGLSAKEQFYTSS